MKTLITCFAFSFFVSVLTAQVWYVKEGGTGQGTSWADATGDLNAALFVARENKDQVWVAKGTYYPSYINDRTRAFEVPDGVAVYAGFTGTETALEQRDWINNKTILSGEIGEATSKDNSYNIIYTANVSSTTIVDGFTITGGYADQAGSTGERVKCGGGWYNTGMNNVSNPTIRNCRFVANYGRDGGALYNFGSHGEASPIVENCHFIENRADLDGGAIFNNGRRNGKSNPTFTACTFKDNIGNNGGAMMNYGGAGQSNPVLTNCTFINNEAYSKGADLYNFEVEGEAKPTLNSCQMTNTSLTATMENFSGKM